MGTPFLQRKVGALEGRAQAPMGCSCFQKLTDLLVASVIKLWFMLLRGLLCSGQRSEPSRQCPLFSR